MALYLNDVLIEFAQYPNGEFLAPALPTERSVVRWHWEGDHEFLQLALLRDQLEGWPNLEIAYMPYSRMDRPSHNDCFSLAAAAGLINSMSWWDVTVWDPHSDETLKLLNQAKPIFPNVEVLPDVKREIGWSRLHGDCLVLPDAGAKKRYGQSSSDIFLSKKRNFETGKIEGIIFDPESPMPTARRRAIILDDLSSRGGTFIGAADLLRGVGFERVYLLVTHIETTAWEGDLFEALDGVWASDSMPKPQHFTHETPKFHLYTKENWTK